MNRLRDYVTLKFLGSNRYIVGFKDKKIPRELNRHIFQRVQEHDIKDLECLLQNYWREDDLFAPGVQFAYDFFAENIRLLDKYPEWMFARSHFYIKDRQFDIGVYRNGDYRPGLTFRAIHQICDEYSRRIGQKNMDGK